MIGPRSVRLGKLAAWGAVAVLFVGTNAAGQALPPPPLKPGEAIAVTADGCALVGMPTDRAQFREQTRRLQWRGPCRNGLAHGRGEIAYPPANGSPGGSFAAEYAYGRTPPIYPTVPTGTGYRTVDGRTASASSDAELDNPRWTEDLFRGTRVQVGGESVFTDLLILPGAAAATGFDPPGYVPDPGGPKYSIFAAGASHPCPDPRTSVGCEVLWRQLAGPLIASYRTIRDEVQRYEPAWRAEMAQLNAARDARFAALEIAAGQAFERSQAAAQADSGKAEREFKAQLAAANAGRLFTLADEFEGAGDIDKARQALRTLINRFPDHGLAVTAAQRLTALPQVQGPASSADCAAPAEEARIAGGLRTAMSRIPSTNAVWQYEAILEATQNSAAAWSRCPQHPASAAKLRNYRTAYIEAARKCAMISPTGACTPNMH